MSQMHSWFFLLGRWSYLSYLDHYLDYTTCLFSILVLLLSSMDALLVFLTERIEAKEKPFDKRKSKSGKKSSVPPLQPA